MQRSPIVSVIVPNYNGAPFLADALNSACRQTLSDIEIIVSDDASSDGSVDIVRQLMIRDARIRLTIADRNGGPAAARNRALAAAGGEWIAVLDNDDLMHPERLASLVEAGKRDGADIVADDLLIFDDRHVDAPASLLRGRWAREPFWVDVSDYVRLNKFFGRRPALGYLKPVFRSSLLTSADVRYDERLRVAEDFEFMLRLLLLGAKFRVYPILHYFYRRHVQSISHRLTVAALEAIRTVDRESRERLGNTQGALATAMKSRARSIDVALAFNRIVEALKRRDIIAAGRAAMEEPRALALLRLPVAARARKLIRIARHDDRSDRRNVCILTRQRVIGATNGSSAYLLELAQALDRAGFDVHLVSPSPKTLGRWPYLSLRDSTSVFRTVRVRGTYRIGRYLVSADPRRYWTGFLALAEQLLLRTRVISRPMLRSAPYAVAEPLTRVDQLYIAKHVPKIGDALIADYCYLTPTFAYALRPQATTAVVMHDLFSSRARQFTTIGTADSVVSLTEPEECAMLAKADAVIAIQKEEAAVLAKRMPRTRIIVAPMAARPVKAPQPGHADQVLFVGSSAAANVDGLHWFLERCWSEVRAMRPGVRLRVAGTVCQKVGRPPPAVELLGLVDDLSALYAGAGLVISPLRAGSGLKIKLIEALGHGKAVVATSVTLQGVADLLHDCVCVADEPDGFAAAMIDLSGDEQARVRFGSRGLAAVARHFSASACYDQFVRAMSERGGCGDVVDRSRAAGDEARR